MKTEQLANIYETLKRKCKRAGTDLTQVCRDAGIDRSIPERWKKENPKTLDIVVKLLQAIENKQKEIIIPSGGKEKVTR
jgi:hypothetical protein